MAQTAQRIVVLIGLLGLGATSPRVARACVQDDHLVVYSVLGISGYIPREMQPRLPRNVAFVFWSGDSRPPQLTAAGSAVELELLGPEPEHGQFGLLTPRELLEPGVMYEYDGYVPVVVDDYIDEVAPGPAHILRATLTTNEGSGCLSSDSCGGEGSVFVRAQLEPGTDEHTKTEFLTYAIYLGTSAQEALTSSQAGHFLRLEGREASFSADYEWSDRDMFLSVAVFDHAGNESTRSEPIKIHSAPAGCSAAHSSDFHSLVWILAAIGWRCICANRRNAGARGRRGSSS